MEDILQKMDAEKRYKLINSALEEFSNNTFDKASTNKIVKRAGISKGLLYHYFESKKSLYDYLVIFSFKSIVDPIMDEVGLHETDIITRIKEIALVKLRVAEKYPSIIGFFKSMYRDKSYEDIKKILDHYAPDLYYQLYHHNIDFSLFRDELDVQKATNIIQWTVEGFSEKYFQEFKNSDKETDFEGVLLELDQYLNMLRKALYR